MERWGSGGRAPGRAEGARNTESERALARARQRRNTAPRAEPTMGGVRGVVGAGGGATGAGAGRSTGRAGRAIPTDPIGATHAEARSVADGPVPTVRPDASDDHGSGGLCLRALGRARRRDRCVRCHVGGLRRALRRRRSIPIASRALETCELFARRCLALASRGLTSCLVARAGLCCRTRHDHRRRSEHTIAARPVHDDAAAAADEHLVATDARGLDGARRDLGFRLVARFDLRGPPLRRSREAHHRCVADAQGARGQERRSQRIAGRDVPRARALAPIRGPVARAERSPRDLVPASSPLHPRARVRTSWQPDPRAALLGAQPTALVKTHLAPGVRGHEREARIARLPATTREIRHERLVVRLARHERFAMAGHRHPRAVRCEERAERLGLAAFLSLRPRHHR